MLPACFFCDAGHGRKEEIESLPVGERLAFDAARGGSGWCAAPAAAGT